MGNGGAGKYWGVYNKKMAYRAGALLSVRAILLWGRLPPNARAFALEVWHSFREYPGPYAWGL